MLVIHVAASQLKNYPGAEILEDLQVCSKLSKLKRLFQYFFCHQTGPDEEQAQWVFQWLFLLHNYTRG